MILKEQFVLTIIPNYLKIFYMYLIEDELHSFEEGLKQMICGIKLKNYLALYRHILEAEQMPEDELVRRAKAIKPLVRLDKDGNRRHEGDFEESDRLVFVKPCDIRESYLYIFKPRDIVTINPEARGSVPLEVPEVEVVTSFICYHNSSGYYQFFCPSVDEVLSQIPPSVDLSQVHGFEIKVDSLNLWDTFDNVLDRHVTTVILYKMKGGLPEEIASQKVICRHKEY